MNGIASAANKQAERSASRQPSQVLTEQFAGYAKTIPTTSTMASAGAGVATADLETGAASVQEAETKVKAQVAEAKARAAAEVAEAQARADKFRLVCQLAAEPTLCSACKTNPCLDKDECKLRKCILTCAEDDFDQLVEGFEYETRYYICLPEDMKLADVNYTFKEGFNFAPVHYWLSFTTKQNIRTFSDRGPLVQAIWVPPGIPVRNWGSSEMSAPVLYCIGPPIRWQVHSQIEHYENTISWCNVFGGVEVLFDSEILEMLARDKQIPLPPSLTQYIVDEMMQRMKTLEFRRLLQQGSTRVSDICATLRKYIALLTKVKRDLADKKTIKCDSADNKASKFDSTQVKLDSEAAKSEMLTKYAVFDLGYNVLKSYSPALDEKFCRVLETLGGFIGGSLAIKMLLRHDASWRKLENCRLQFKAEDIDIFVRACDASAIADRLQTIGGWSCTSNVYDAMPLANVSSCRIQDVFDKWIDVQLISIRPEKRSPVSDELDKYIDLSFCRVKFDGRRLHVPADMLLSDNSVNPVGQLINIAVSSQSNLTRVLTLLRCVKYLHRGFAIENLDKL